MLKHDTHPSKSVSLCTFVSGMRRILHRCINQTNHGTQYLTGYRRLPAGIDPERGMDRQTFLRHRRARTRQSQRRGYEHAAHARPARGAPGLRDRHPQRVHSSDALPPVGIRAGQRCDVQFQNHVGSRRGSGPYLPYLRRVQGWQGRRHTGRRRRRSLPSRRRAMPHRFYNRTDTLALRIAQLDERRNRLSDLYRPRFR